MYYKIENKECEIYKKLYSLRSKELHMETDNRQAINEKTGLAWNTYFGNPGQQNYRRVSIFTGFCFSGMNCRNTRINKHE